jgi:hypothetical protein
VIDQFQAHAQPRLAHRAEHGGDFLTREHHGQDERLGDAHLTEHRPAGALMAIDEEGAQGELGRLHGRAGVVLVLAQEQEVGAQLIRGEGERIDAEMFGEFADVADVFLFGRRAVIFEFDKLLELCDGGIGSMNHKAARLPVSAETRSPPI